jgi:hypothetical protein
VGYGDITPTTTYEYLIVMMCEIAAAGTFAYIISSIGQLFSRYN